MYGPQDIEHIFVGMDDGDLADAEIATALHLGLPLITRDHQIKPLPDRSRQAAPGIQQEVAPLFRNQPPHEKNVLLFDALTEDQLRFTVDGSRYPIGDVMSDLLVLRQVVFPQSA